MSWNRKTTRHDRKNRKGKCLLSRGGKHIVPAHIKDGRAFITDRRCVLCGRLVFGPAFIHITRSYRYAKFPLAFSNT